MTTDQPSNAPDDIGENAREDATVAAAMTDDRLDANAGGGGLGGQSAAEGDPQRNRPAGAAERALPLDTAAAGDDAPNRAQDEAKLQADTAEPHPRSL